jgi:hypothetical protein
VDQGEVAAIDDARIRRSRGADEFSDTRDVEDIGEAQHLLDSVKFVRGANAFLQDETFQHAREPGIVVSRHAGAERSRGKRECRGAVTALRGHRDIVLPPEMRTELGALRKCWPWRHGDDAVDVRIALNDPRGVGKDQHIDSRIGPRAAQAADQRRRQKQIADAAQGDDKDA